MDSELTVSRQRLQIEATWLMNCCLFANSPHWSTYPNPRPKKYPYIVIRVAYLRRIDWFGFIFSKYHLRAIAVFQDLPISERHFFEYVNDAYKRFRVWLIAGKHFEPVSRQLQPDEKIELEFIVQPDSFGLVVPKPFEKFNLTFYQRGKHHFKSC
jgi:hypothetical protein